MDKKNFFPESYRNLEKQEIVKRIIKLKERFGDELIILAHHYQRDEIVELSDYKGDSFKLSKIASSVESAKYIVFCGVHFMAESAEILSREGQYVFIPDIRAGCPMADLAFIEDVEMAWRALGELFDLEEIIPVAYVNSDAELKAFCGKNNGSTCTSSNAKKVFEWAFEKGEKVFFFPDEHLGRNTSYSLGLKENELALWDPELVLGGNSEEEVKRAKVFLWKGYCHVHTFFKPEDVLRVRKEYPQVKVIVHPECVSEVVKLSDAQGSTENIIKYVEEAKEGSTIAVGTEIHLVERLARREKGKKVVPLARSICPNMYKINLFNLLWVLERISEGEKSFVNRIIVSDDVKRDARKALEQMLKLS